jgi:hypothetical protein
MVNSLAKNCYIKSDRNSDLGMEVVGGRVVARWFKRKQPEKLMSL